MYVYVCVCETAAGAVIEYAMMDIFMLRSRNALYIPKRESVVNRRHSDGPAKRYSLLHSPLFDARIA